jgi:hypothetical protein
MSYFVFQYEHDGKNPHPGKLVMISGVHDCDIVKVEAFHADENIWMVVARTRQCCHKTSFTTLLRNHLIEPVLFPDYVSAVSQYYTVDELSRDFMWCLIRDACTSGDASYVCCMSEDGTRRTKRKAQYISTEKSARDELMELLAERDRIICSLQTTVCDLQSQLAKKDRQVKALLGAFK